METTVKKMEDKEVENDQQAVDFCLKKLQEEKQAPQSFKEIFDLIGEIDFNEVKKDQVILLAEQLLSLPSKHENQYLGEEDELSLYMLAKKYGWLYTRIAYALGHVAPYIPDELRQKCFNYLRSVIEDPRTDQALREASMRSFLRVAHHLKKEYRRIAYEFLMNRLKYDELFHDWTSLLKIAQYWLDQAERRELLIVLVKLLDGRANDRAHQKNIEYVIVKLFQEVVFSEQEVIFNTILVPLKASRNYFVRQALVEILDRITGFEEQRKALLLALKEDEHPEVRRFANQAAFFHSLERDGKEAKETKKVTRDDVVKLYSKLNKKGGSRSSKVTPQEEELKQFEREQPVSNPIDYLMKGLHHKNRLIMKYCFETLKTRYTRNTDIHTKRKWLHILTEGLTKGSRPLATIDITDHIFWDIRPVEGLRDELVRMLLAVINANLAEVDRDWINLIYSVNSAGISDAAFSEILRNFVDIFQDKNAPSWLKNHLFSMMSSLKSKKSNPKHYFQVIGIFVQGFNGGFSYDFHALAGEQIRDELSSIESIEEVSLELLSLLSHIRFDSPDQETAKQVLRFMIWVISQDGAGEQGQCVVKKLSEILLNLRDASLVTFIREQCAVYEIESLDIVKSLFSIVEKQLAQLPKESKHHAEEDSAYQKGLQAMAEGKYGEAIDYFKRAAGDDPFYLEPLLKLHELYSRMHAYHDAERVFQRIRQLNPRFRSPYPRYQLSYESVPAEGDIPYKESIQMLEKALEDFIASSIEALEKENSSATQEAVRKNFEIFCSLLESVFGKSAVDKFKPMHEIPWQKLFDYPKQITRYMRDLLIGIICQEIPPPYHKFYRIFQVRAEDLRSLERQVQETGIERYLDDEKAMEFLTARCHAMTVYEFVKKYAFQPNLNGGYALGISSDISQTYNIFCGIFGLKHWSVAYRAYDVVATGDMPQTEEFLNKLLEQNKPVVMFVPILIEAPNHHNVTLDEVRFLIKKVKESGRFQQIIFVFDAYNFLPMFVLESGPVEGRLSIGKSFQSVMMYFADVLGYDIKQLKSLFKRMLEHMLMTRLEVNLINNYDPDNAICRRYFDKFDKLLRNEELFMDLLSNLMEELVSYSDDMRKIDNFLICLQLLDNLLLTELPWFGSHLQIPQEHEAFLQNVYDHVLKKKQTIENSLQDNRFQASTIRGYKTYIAQMDEFLSNLQQLIQDVRRGAQWLGLSNYAAVIEYDEKKEASLPPNAGRMVADRRIREGLNAAPMSMMTDRVEPAAAAAAAREHAMG